MRRTQVLLKCLKGLLLNEDHFDIVASADASWICRRLAWHKLLPLAAALNDSGKPKCATIEQIFKTTTLENLAKEEFYRLQVARIFNAFDKASIEYMPFKGPFWGNQLYAEYYWRHIGDIDILFSKDEARTAGSILLKMGYIPHTLDGSIERDFETRGELAFFPDSRHPNEVPIELHWDLMPSPRFLKKKYLFNEDFNQDVTRSQWKGFEYDLPRPEVQFLYYILHATCQHQFMRFVHITNLVHFVQKFPRLNWQRIFKLAESRRALTPLYYGLKFVDTYFPLPEHVSVLQKRSKPSLPTQMVASFMPPGKILSATYRRGKMRRKLFRAAMSW